MDITTSIPRRKFLLQIGAVSTAGCACIPPSSAAPTRSSKLIKLSVWPEQLPFLLDETFGPTNAKGSDIHKWLTVLRFEIIKHHDARGRDALVENVISDRFEGEVAITASTHEASSVKDFDQGRWDQLNPVANRKNIWIQRLNDRNGNPKIFVYDSKPLRASHPIGFKWTVDLNDAGRLALKYSDMTREAQELPIDSESPPKSTGFQLGLALDPAPESSAASARSVNAHAAAYSAWTPTEDIRAVDIFYNEDTPNFDLRRTPSLPEVAMASNRGGIGIGYMATKPGP